jgi:hypothetical protein
VLHTKILAVVFRSRARRAVVMPEEPGYRVHAGEPAIFVEIYLPKKADFQGRLYESLTRGFDVEAVRRHFKEPERRDRIRELFRRYDPRLSCEGDRVDAMREVLFGYSMYEVDGVFRAPGDGSRGVQEERNQVIRMVFKPDYPGIAERSGATLEAVREMAGERFHAYRERNGSVLSDAAGRTSEPEKLVAEELRSWIEDVSLFLFGYVVYELCERVAELRDGAGRRPEEEIWVTSFWEMTVNRVVRAA